MSESVVSGIISFLAEDMSYRTLMFPNLSSHTVVTKTESQLETEIFLFFLEFLAFVFAFLLHILAELFVLVLALGAESILVAARAVKG